MSLRNATIDFNAADSSFRESSVPITILRCFLFCPEQDSLQRYSQTSGPRRREERMRLPFCMAASHLGGCIGTILAQMGRRHLIIACERLAAAQSSGRFGRGLRIEPSGTAFLRRCPAVCHLYYRGCASSGESTTGVTSAYTPKQDYFHLTWTMSLPSHVHVRRRPSPL